MEPAQAVAAIENALRLAIREVLPGWQAKLTPEAMAKLREKAEVEERKRDGAATSRDLLDYTEFHQLTGLVLGSWEEFKPIFDDKARTKVLFDLAEDYRNPAAHNRELLDFEVELLSGGAGQIRNQVAIFRSMNVDQARFYPKIEAAVDQFGRAGYTSEPGMNAPAPMRLEVGDTITIRVRAVSARNFPIQWRAYFVDNFAMAYMYPDLTIEPVEGDEVELTYTVRPEDVKEFATFVVIASTASKHHRHDKVDDVVFFRFAVSPPEDE